MPADKKKILHGTVMKKTAARGSKSEHEAFYLHTGNKEYLLRKIGGNPFETAVDFARFEGKTVTCHGSVDDYVLNVDSIQ